MAVAGTFVKYGNLEIHNVLTQSFQQEAVMDDSGVDLLFFRYTIRIVGYVTDIPGGTLGFYPVSGFRSPTMQLSQMQYRFAPRQTFTMIIGANTLLTAAPAVAQNPAPPIPLSGLDCENGPQARVISAVRIASDASIRLELEFKVSLVECAADGSTTNVTGILNSRWSCTDEIDQDWYTTRTFNGRLRLATAQVDPQSFRGWVIPPLQMGMYRRDIQMTSTTDGLHLDWSVVDREVAFSPPAPATDWSFRITSRRSLEDIFWHTDIDVMLKGNRYVDKKKLIAIASAICDAKFGGGNPAAPNYTVESISIADEYNKNENTIHLSATARRNDNAGPAIKGMQASWLGKPIDANDLAPVIANPPGYDSRLSPGSPGRAGDSQGVWAKGGTVGAMPIFGAFSTFLMGPCGGDYTFLANATNAVDSQGPSTNPLPTISALVVTELSDDNSLGRTSSLNSQGAYTYWKLNSEYDTDQTRVHCPIAEQSGSSGSSGITSVVCNLGSPGGLVKRTIRYMVERIGVEPVVPEPTDSFQDENGITCVLIDNLITSSSPVYGPDDKIIYQVGGEITYALTGKLQLTSQLRMGFNSWEEGRPLYKKVFPTQQA
jgi:hypothetical protein